MESKHPIIRSYSSNLPYIGNTSKSNSNSNFKLLMSIFAGTMKVPYEAYRQRAIGNSPDGKDYGKSVVAGTYSAFSLRNFFMGLLVQSGRVTPNPSTRLGALESTLKFRPDTLGHSVKLSIQAIHTILGNIGQSNIGTLFHSKDAQDLMKQSITKSNSTKLAQQEYSFWLERFKGYGAKGKATMGERVGGVMGSVFTPQMRNFLQQGFAMYGKNFPVVVSRNMPFAVPLVAAYTAYMNLPDHSN